jgi:acylglycerol lipase
MTTSILTTDDGVKLHLEYHSVERPRATIVFTHGYAEHIGRYTWMFDQLNQRDLNIVAYDQRGHGRSGGERAYVESFDQYTADMHQVLNTIPSDKPIFLMAHSMGGLVSAKYLIDYDHKKIRGYISSAGAYKVDKNLSPILQKISGVIAAIAPKLKTIKLDASLVSSIPAEVQLYMTDPYNYHDGTKARFGAQMLATIRYVRAQASKLTLPILFMHGDADKLIDPEGSQYMYDHCSSQTKTIHFFKNAYHEIMREPEKDRFIRLTTDFIHQQVNK